MREIDFVKTFSQELETFGETGDPSSTLYTRIRCRDDRHQFCFVVDREAYADLISKPWFIQAFKPAPSHEIVTKGSVGQVFGLPILTNAYQHPDTCSALPPLASNMIYLGRIVYKDATV